LLRNILPGWQSTLRPISKKQNELSRKAFEIQVKNNGFALVEVLSTCPTNWGLAPEKALRWLEDNMMPYYPLGDFKVPKEVE